MALKDYLFTSESVSEGHPDKVADQISDAILDEHIKGDKLSRVALETLVTTDRIILSGEITSDTDVDYEEVARQVVSDVGYSDTEIGFDCKTCNVEVYVHAQSADISQGVTPGAGMFKEQGAGDQGMMFGYAVAETPEMMPMPISLAHKIVSRLADVRKSGDAPFIRPDSKSQVTIQYEDNRPKRVDTIVISTQHSPEVSIDTLTGLVRESVLPQVIPENLMDNSTKLLVNPTGNFVIGGPNGDTGLTGRKIIVDTYGGMGRHGGGAFSGKDPSKVDRSAAYMSRYIAKNIVAAGLAHQCEIQLAYAIGVADPVSVMVSTFNTGKVEEEEIARRVREVFNMKPAGIIETLDLLRPIYRSTSNYGHFGREDAGFIWEMANMKERLQ